MPKTDSLIIIPARMAATRLPGKPLALINDEPMIVHVWKRACQSEAGPVIVACGDIEIKETIEKYGGKAILTDPSLPSGSDRVWSAAEIYDPGGKFNIIVNVQGDQPTLDPKHISKTIDALRDSNSNMSTLITPINNQDEINDPSVIKVAIDFQENTNVATALYFSRNPIPYGEGPLYHHVGIYGFTRASLKKFVSIKPSELEKRERLEQLRALTNGFKISAYLVDHSPPSVDTPEDLERVRTILENN
ncbi:MAG: 3-deoxy-manno-octulosonate cytidylyltransferase [Alphaproteobacteria bacterium TMED87]|nr:3-deoxy-manno-octulosonate cytidylyltransferase [Rhodospirillaceae bacterium]OUV09758.1 MAG: 3-deoxy-manno-octulosonate cytidylyltransferase [Alphaproteobacteria bacterium TMED87]